MDEKEKPNNITMGDNELADRLGAVVLGNTSNENLDLLIQVLFSKASNNHPKNTAALVSVLVTEKQSRIIDKQGKTSKRLSWLSLIISGVALIVVLVFAGLDYYGDKKWQESQAKLLNNQTTILQQIRDSIPTPQK